MKKIIDHFSDQSAQYKQFRPNYPAAFYSDLLKLCNQKEKALDCGTGNGQVARVLAQNFTEVVATDISENQLSEAFQAPNINYRVERSEASSAQDETIDLLTVAQAYHWFDQGAFMKESLRILKPGGILAIWGYSLLRISPEINELLDHFHDNTMGPYWDEKRKLIDAAYRTVEFSYKDVYLPHSHCISDDWHIDQLRGYLNSWSSVKTYKQNHPDSDPVELLMKEIKLLWEGEKMPIKFPLFYRIGRKEN